MIGGKFKVKVCGMTDGANIREVEEAGADIIGFIFCAASPRNVKSMPDYLPLRAARAGVFVNERPDKVAETAGLFGLDYVQLHGSETPDYCRTLASLGIPAERIVKVFHISGGEGLPEDIHDFDSICGACLFDTRVGKSSMGGTGLTFDWTSLLSYGGPLPFLLSGGIGPGHIQELTGFRHPFLAGYDLNSRFETAPGIKDAAAVAGFIAGLESALNFKNTENEQDK